MRVRRLVPDPVRPSGALTGVSALNHMSSSRRTRSLHLRILLVAMGAFSTGADCASLPPPSTAEICDPGSIRLKIVQGDKAVDYPPPGMEFDTVTSKPADRNAALPTTCSKGVVLLTIGSNQTNGKEGKILEHYRRMLSKSGWNTVPVDRSLRPETRVVARKEFDDWTAEVHIVLTQAGLGVSAFYPPVTEDIP